MARVDFSNATIEFLNSAMYNNAFWALNGYGGTNFYKLFDSEGNSVASGNQPQVTTSTKGFTITRSGTFETTGTEFYIRGNITGYDLARVSNILFTPGDTYSFDIQVDVP